MLYYTVTLNCDLLTPKLKAFISVPKCINTVSLVKICQTFQQIVLTKDIKVQFPAYFITL